MVKVLHIIPSLLTGGAETFVVRAAKALDPMQVECRVYVCRPAVEDGRDLGDLPITFDSGEGGRRGTIRRLCSIIRQWRPDVVHLHLSLVGYVAARLAGARKIIIHHHTGYPASVREIRGLYLYETYLKRHLTLACSESVRRQSIEINRIRPSKVKVLHNGIDLDVFDELSHREEVRPGFERQGDEVVLVTLGRLVELKGLDTLLRGLRLLPPSLKWRLVIGGDGDQAQSLQELAHHLGLDERVCFIGSVPPSEVPSLLTSCDILVQPSRREGLPLSIIEAGAAGLPIVASNVGGMPEVIVDGVNGLLVPPNEPEALSSAIAKLLSDPEQRRMMAVNSRRTIEEEFAMPAIARQLTTIYQELTGKT